jgi:Zn-dependent protease
LPIRLRFSKQDLPPVLIAEPSRSPYDVFFSVFGTRVRVHPMFWLVSLLMGIKLEEPVLVLMWIFVVFLSILIHELGHVVAFRYFGMDADVVLYSFGGLAIARRPVFRGHWAQVAISFAGPLAGFIVTGIIYAALRATGTVMRFYFGFPDVIDYRVPYFEPFNLYVFVEFMLQVNLYWGLVNLLPIYPLDGGQISRSLMEQFNVPDAVHKSLILSMVAAGWMVLVGLKQESVFLALMFGYLGYQNYLAMQENRGRYNRSPW